MFCKPYVMTSWWRHLEELRAKYPDLFVVKVSNTAHGYQWDYDWRAVFPSWSIINNVRDGVITELEYDHQYMQMLEKNEVLIRAEWNAINRAADGRPIVLMCHEATGHCHRFRLAEFLEGAW